MVKRVDNQVRAALFPAPLVIAGPSGALLSIPPTKPSRYLPPSLSPPALPSSLTHFVIRSLSPSLSLPLPPAPSLTRPRPAGPSLLPPSLPHVLWHSLPRHARIPPSLSPTHIRLHILCLICILLVFLSAPLSLPTPTPLPDPSLSLPLPPSPSLSTSRSPPCTHDVSAVGKATLISKLFHEFPNAFSIPISHTSRYVSSSSYDMYPPPHGFPDSFSIPISHTSRLCVSVCVCVCVYVCIPITHTSRLYIFMYVCIH